jgi:hypothetical protein
MSIRTKFSFWTATPSFLRDQDTVQIGGRIIPPSETIQRGLLVRSISFIKEGKKVFDKGGVKIFLQDEEFVVEVTTTEMCYGKLLSPVAIHGNYERDFRGQALVPDAQLGKEVIQAFNAFMVNVGRNVDIAQNELIFQGFKGIKDSAEARETLEVLGLCAGIGALVGLAVWASTR